MYAGKAHINTHYLGGHWQTVVSWPGAADTRAAREVLPGL
jgi:hypothetical protein